MSGYYKQMHHGDNEARSKLQERLTRKKVGDAAYDEAASCSMITLSRSLVLCSLSCSHS